MGIIQFSSTGAALILEKQIRYLSFDVVGISSDFIFFCAKIHNLISLVLDHGKCFVSLVYTWSSIVGMTSLKRIFQNSFDPEVL